MSKWITFHTELRKDGRITIPLEIRENENLSKKEYIAVRIKKIRRVEQDIPKEKQELIEKITDALSDVETEKLKLFWEEVKPVTELFEEDEKNRGAKR